MWNVETKETVEDETTNDENEHMEMTMGGMRNERFEFSYYLSLIHQEKVRRTICLIVRLVCHYHVKSIS